MDWWTVLTTSRAYVTHQKHVRILSEIRAASRFPISLGFSTASKKLEYYGYVCTRKNDKIHQRWWGSNTGSRSQDWRIAPKQKAQEASQKEKKNPRWKLQLRTFFLGYQSVVLPWERNGIRAKRARFDEAMMNYPVRTMDRNTPELFIQEIFGRANNYFSFLTLMQEKIILECVSEFPSLISHRNGIRWCMHYTARLCLRSLYSNSYETAVSIVTWKV